MKLILTQTVKDLGDVGATVEVATGYARNFLLPHGLAVPATPEAERQLKAAGRRRVAAEVSRQLELRELCQRLTGLSVHIRAKVNEAGRLFGSVGPAEIAQAVQEEHQLPLEPAQVLLPEPLKKPDVYTVKLRLSPTDEGELKVWVLEE